MGFYWHRIHRASTTLRDILVSAIYQKTTQISITALDNKAAVTLMSTDIDRITSGFAVLHELWANLAQIISTQNPPTILYDKSLMISRE